VLAASQGAYKAVQPRRLRSATCVSEDDNLAAGRPDADVALVGDADAKFGRWLELQPSHVAIVTSPNVIKPPLGCVHDDDLARFFQALYLTDYIGDRVIEGWLVFAEDDNGDHQWNTSDDPSVYTRS
jgi:hypothetical protein